MLHFRPEHFKIFEFVRQQIDRRPWKARPSWERSKKVILFVHKKRMYAKAFREPGFAADAAWQYFFLEQFAWCRRAPQFVDMRRNADFLEKDLRPIFDRMLSEGHLDVFRRIYADSFNLVALDRTSFRLAFGGLMAEIAKGAPGSAPPR